MSTRDDMERDTYTPEKQERRKKELLSGQPSAALSTPSRLRELLSRSTKSSFPWRVRFDSDEPKGWRLGSENIETLADFGDDDSARADADVVAAAVNNLGALLNVAETAEGVVAEVTEIALGWRDDWPVIDGRVLRNQMHEATADLRDALAALDNKEPRPSGDNPESPTDETEETT